VLTPAQYQCCSISGLEEALYEYIQNE